MATHTVVWTPPPKKWWQFWKRGRPQKLKYGRDYIVENGRMDFLKRKFFAGSMEISYEYVAVCTTEGTATEGRVN